jgi:hypothetical protein
MKSDLFEDLLMETEKSEWLKFKASCLKTRKSSKKFFEDLLKAHQTMGRNM